MRGQAGVRHHRDAAPHRGEIPPRGQRRRRQAAAGARQAIAGQRPELGGARLQLLPAPVQHRRGPRSEPPPARPRPRRPGAVARQPARDRADAGPPRRRPGPHPPPAGRGLRDAGADRPPHRSAAQEHAGRTPRDRPGAGPPRRHAHARGAGRDRRHAAGPRGHAVADPHAALHPSDGGRRDRERAVVLPQHLPAGDSAPVRRPVAPLEPRVGQALRRAAPAAGTVPAHGQLDRRRPRRQSQRRRRHAGTRAAAPGHGAVRTLSAGGPRAGRGPVHDHAADCRRPGPAGAGRPQRRRFPAPRRRALPPRAGRRVRPPGRHRPGPDRPEPGPPQHRGGPGL